MAKQQLTFGQKLAQQRELRSQGAAVNYDRAVLLVCVYEDDDFRAECRANESEASEVLDDECGDLCCSFLQIKAVLERFPRKEQWTSQRLQDMLAVVLDENRRETGERTAPRPSWKQRNEELMAEVERLKRENDVLRWKLEELEKVLSRQLSS